MSNCYYERTGVLVFNGVPRLTKVVRALFSPFKLDPDQIGDITDDKSANEMEIGEFADDNDVSWEAIARSIAENAVDLRIAFPADADPADIRPWLSVLAAHFSVTNGLAQRLLDADQFDGDADPCTLFDLATEFNDGHNLIAVKYEAAWHADSTALYGFGGSGTFHSPRVSLTVSTKQIRKTAEAVDAALWANDIDAAACALSRVIDSLLTGITDESARAKIREQMGAGR